jgi:hypothetical protein
MHIACLTPLRDTAAQELILHTVMCMILHLCIIVHALKPPYDRAQGYMYIYIHTHSCAYNFV